MYWGWVICWCGFIGGFVGRVCGGGRIREFVVGVVIIGGVIWFRWIGGFGGRGIKVGLNDKEKVVDIVDKDYSVGLFELL